MIIQSSFFTFKSPSLFFYELGPFLLKKIISFTFICGQFFFYHFSLIFGLMMSNFQKVIWQLSNFVLNHFFYLLKLRVGEYAPPQHVPLWDNDYFELKAIEKIQMQEKLLPSSHLPKSRTSVCKAVPPCLSTWKNKVQFPKAALDSWAWGGHQRNLHNELY